MVRESGRERDERAPGSLAVTGRLVSEEVSLERYLAARRPIPHLFEITPDLDPAAFALDGVVDPAGTEVSGTALASTVRARGDRETDVRLLVDDGERFLTLANDLANTLGCDVYLTPHGAVVRYLHEVNPVTTDVWEAVAVDPPIAPPVLVAATVDPRYARDLQPEYPAGERRAERTGTVTVRVTIGRDGRVTAAECIASASDAFCRATRAQALSKWRFRPATRDGVAVESTREMTVRFQLAA